ncbi:DUF6879 family protein [Nonomuraea aurantiaca]|uniref:DUF6879 family protein n=1 Tax=Nonomuraea aurantiaca TaxID=2878562 RepID=UPI001CD9AA33|nr:DUF6879 family protein [Nonomuraea aurantiaca]MCA2220489.1 hypothetical protein [Nonomuraea aurantiaca]
MTVLLSEAELGDLLATFTTSAFRFELRERYNSAVGAEPFRKWQAGESDDYAWHRSWMEKISRDVASGKTWQRVRIVSVPPSDYTRYGMKVAQLSVRAGEDIRYLRRDVAARLGLDPYDAWLLDGSRLIWLHFDDADDTFAGAELVTDREVVSRHLAWRDLALKHAQSLDEFAAHLR